MRRSAVIALVAFAATVTTARAQHDHAAMAASPSPYTGLLGREIKALSDTQVAQYRNGEGMGYALAAELNHYPGPKHVVELADSLGLSESQRSTIAGIRDRMTPEARRLGAQIIELEHALDRSFADGTLTEARLRSLTADIAQLQGELRFAHLRSHLAVRAALTPEQIRRYDVLRGYAPARRGGSD